MLLQWLSAEHHSQFRTSPLFSPQICIQIHLESVACKYMLNCTQGFPGAWPRSVEGTYLTVTDVGYVHILPSQLIRSCCCSLQEPCYSVGTPYIHIISCDYKLTYLLLKTNKQTRTQYFVGIYLKERQACYEHT